MNKRIQLPESVKRQHQREKRLMSRRMAAAEAAALDEARSSLHTAAQRQMTAVSRTNRDAIFNGIHGMVSAVAKSWGIGNAIFLTQSHRSQISASTDFVNIHISYPERAVSSNVASTKEIAKFDDKALRTLVSDIKGLAYHEVGHIRFTVPLPELCEMAGVPVDWITPAFKTTWNVLEDQRMESAVVAESPVVAAYFTTMVYNWLLKDQSSRGTAPEQFVLISGRRYLPRPLRQAMRAKFAAKHGITLTKQVEECIRLYKAASTPAEMTEQVATLTRLLAPIGGAGGGVDTHSPSTGGKPNKGESNSDKIKASSTSDTDDTPDEQEQEQTVSAPVTDEADEGSESKGAGGTTDEQADDEQEEDDRGQGGDDADDEEEEEAPSPLGTDGGADDAPTQTDDNGSGTGHSPDGSDDFDVNKEIRDLLEQAMDDLTNSDTVSDVIRDINERANTSTSSLSSYVPRVPQNPAMSAKSEELVSALIPTLEVYTADSAPIWQTHQTRGIIDPFTYRTRPSGSSEYRRQYDDTGNTGIDIAVTIMLDVSTSMIGSEYGLGAVAYASKTACDALSIPCTVCTFNHSGYILWGKDDQPEHTALVCDGGTSPTELFNALDEQFYEKSTQLVIVMTDGVFSLNGGCDRYRSDETNRFFVGLAYGSEANVGALMRLGFDHSQQINDLLQIPEILGSFIASYL